VWRISGQDPPLRQPLKPDDPGEWEVKEWEVKANGSHSAVDVHADNWPKGKEYTEREEGSGAGTVVIKRYGPGGGKADGRDGSRWPVIFHGKGYTLKTTAPPFSFDAEWVEKREGDTVVLSGTKTEPVFLWNARLPEERRPLAYSRAFPAGSVLASTTLLSFTQGPKRESWLKRITTWDLTLSSEVKAKAGGPYTVVRGDVLTLDGSKSTGPIMSYEWTFPGAQRVDAKKEGATPTVRVLDNLKACLIVTGQDGKKSKPDYADVVVQPRKGFETKISHVSEIGTIPTSVKIEGLEKNVTLDPVVRGKKKLDGRRVPDPGQPGFLTGINQCSLEKDPWGTAPHAFMHPGGSDAKLFELEQVIDDSGGIGPFHNEYYVKTCNLQISRKTYLNPYIYTAQSQSAIAPRGFSETIPDRNKSNPANWKAYLDAVKAHERRHTQKFEEQKAKGDPAKLIEQWHDTQISQADAEEHVRSRLQALETPFLELTKSIDIPGGQPGLDVGVYWPWRFPDGPSYEKR
jgi:hypothetical protein